VSQGVLLGGSSSQRPGFERAPSVVAEAEHVRSGPAWPHALEATPATLLDM
jgi:hypothetical protein